MAIMTKYNTFKVYPRVHNFQQRLLSLYPRFIRITNYFKHAAYHDKQWLDTIKRRFEVYQKPPLFLTQENTSFDLQKIFVNTSVEGFEQESYGIELFFCYHKLDSGSLETYKDEIDTLVKSDFEMMYEKSGQDLYYFVICQVGDRQMLLRKLPNELKPVSKWDETHFGRCISDILETDLFEPFCGMYDYLQRFTGRTEACLHDFQHFEPADISSTISSFANNLLALNDLKKIHGIEDDSPEESKEFVNIAAEKLSWEICQRIIAILETKFGLKSLVIATMETEFDFHSKLLVCLSKCPSVHKELKILEMQCSDMYIQEHLKVQSNKTRAKLEDCFDVSNLLNMFMDSPALLEFEKLVQGAMANVFEMKKMRYEIERYLEQSVLPFKMRPEPKLSENLVKGIQGLKLNTGKIVRFGIMYGILQVYVWGDDAAAAAADIKKLIPDLLKKDQCWFPYKVFCVEKKMQLLMHTTESQLSAKFSDGYVRNGSAGAFMQCDQGNLYVVTAAHVVARNDEMATSVYLHNQDGRTRVGTPQRQYISCIHDIAAIKIESRLLEEDFQRGIRDSVCMQCAATIFSGSVNDALQDATLSIVYKYGATTNYTEGIIIPPPIFSWEGDQWMAAHLWIDNLSGSGQTFAREGDSGALVCAQSLDNPGQVIVLSMLRGGELMIRDGSEVLRSGGFCTDLFHQGLREIKASGLPLSFRDPNPPHVMPMEEA